MSHSLAGEPPGPVLSEGPARDHWTVEKNFFANLLNREIAVYDIRDRMPTKGEYPKLAASAFRYTAVHHTAAQREVRTVEGDIQSWIGHARHHIDDNGWPGIAYAVGISQSGRVFILRDFLEMGYHAYNANASSFAVCLDCAIYPSFAALGVLREVLEVLHDRLDELPNLTREGTYGHQELTFLDARNTTTACPGKELLEWAKKYRGDKLVVPVRHEVIQVGPFGCHLGGGFLKFWELNGDIPILGFPITEEFLEDGKTVQYCERARLEWYAGTGVVELGLVGTEAHHARYGG